jgi:hypothetical protein
LAGERETFPASNFTDKFLKKPLERGFNIEYVKIQGV